MSDPLYQKDILRLAADAHGHGPLANATVSATVHNPLCGDRVTVHLKLSADGAIEQLHHEARACVLCQASAALLSETLTGRTASDVDDLRDNVERFLKGETETALRGFDVFAPVVSQPSRHTCVLLPVTATQKAFDQASPSS